MKISKLSYLLMCYAVLALQMKAAIATSHGYLNSSYDGIVRTGYNRCLHTAYYKASDGIARCKEAPKVQASQVTSAPVLRQTNTSDFVASGPVAKVTAASAPVTIQKTNASAVIIEPQTASSPVTNKKNASALGVQSQSTGKI